MNEPADGEQDQLQLFYSRIERAIREVDPDHILFLDGNTYAMDFTAFKEVLPNCVYAIHDYATMGFPSGVPYVGSEEQNKQLERQYERKVKFMKERNVPVCSPLLQPTYKDKTDLIRSGTGSSDRSTRTNPRRTTRESTTSATVSSASNSPSTRRTRSAGASGSTKTSASRAWSTLTLPPPT